MGLRRDATHCVTLLLGYVVRGGDVLPNNQICFQCFSHVNTATMCVEPYATYVFVENVGGVCYRGGRIDMVAVAQVRVGNLEHVILHGTRSMSTNGMAQLLDSFDTQVLETGGYLPFFFVFSCFFSCAL